MGFPLDPSTFQTVLSRILLLNSPNAVSKGRSSKQAWRKLGAVKNEEKIRMKMRLARKMNDGARSLSVNHQINQQLL